MGGLYQRFDRFQQRHPWLGFPARRPAEVLGRPGRLPRRDGRLLRVLLDLPAAARLHDRARVRPARPPAPASSQIVNSALGQFPVIGQRADRRSSLKGNALALGARAGGRALGRHGRRARRRERDEPALGRAVQATARLPPRPRPGAAAAARASGAARSLQRRSPASARSAPATGSAGRSARSRSRRCSTSASSGSRSAS